MKSTQQILKLSFVAATLMLAAQFTNAQIGAPATITVANATSITTPPSDTIICGGSAVSAIPFTASTGADSFTISDGASIGLADQGFTLSSIPDFTAVASSTTATTATLTLTPYDNGCQGTSTTFTITIPATATATAPANVSACLGNTVAATTISGTFDSLSWTGGSTVGLADGNSITGTIPSFTTTGTAGTTATVTVTPYNNGCAGTPVTYTIEIPSEAIATAPTNVVVCAGTAVAATTISGTLDSISWSGGAALGLADGGNSTLIIPTFTPTAAAPATTITVTPYVSGCAGSPVTYTVTVNSTPTAASLAAVDSELCPMETAQLTFTVTDGTAPYDITYTINGATPVESVSDINDGDILDTTVPIAPGTNTYQLMTVEDANGCILN